LGVERPLIAAAHHVLLSLVLLTVSPSVELSRRTSTKVCASGVVQLVGVAGNTIDVLPILLAEKVHNHTFVSCRASGAGRCVDLDRVDEDLAGLCRAFVAGCIADWVDCVGTVSVSVASTEVFSSTMTTDWVFVRTVAIVIQPPTSRCTLFPITPEAVVMTWNVAGDIKSYTQLVVVVATKVFNTAADALVITFANVTSWTVGVNVTTTKMVVAAIATDWEELRTVAIVIQPPTPRCTIFPITPEAVVMAWNVAGGIKSYAQAVVVVAAKVFNTAADVLVITLANVTSWTVSVNVTTTKMVVAVIATDREELRAVAVFDATWSAAHIVTVEAVVVVRDVTDSIMAGAVIIQLITTIRNTLLVVAISVQVSCVTDLASLAVFVGVASAKVLRSSVSTDGMRSWTVGICGAALCAVCCAVTVEAVLMCRDVTNSIKTRTLLVFCAARILNAPAAVVAMVAIGAVGVFNALRRTFVIDTGLPWETIACGWGVITVAIIVNRPDAGGAFRGVVELVVEGECPLVSLFTLAQPDAVPRLRSLTTASGALNEAALSSWTTLPEAAAVL